MVYHTLARPKQQQTRLTPEQGCLQTGDNEGADESNLTHYQNTGGFFFNGTNCGISMHRIIHFWLMALPPKS